MSGVPEAPWPQAGDSPEAHGEAPAAESPANDLLAADHQESNQIVSTNETEPTLPLEPEATMAAASEPSLESLAVHSLPLPVRFPNFLDVLLLAMLLAFSWVCSGAVLAGALHFHLWGVTSTKQALNDIHYTLGTQVTWYLIAFAGCLMLFPAIWHTQYFAGVEWNARAAFRKRWRLFAAAFACFMLALADGLLLPGPTDTPIDQVFRMPGAAWLLFAFGVTLAPFFEEMAFRGFLLPAFNTAADWAAERLFHLPTPHPDMEGKPRWSIGAMIVGSLLTSIPFALMHAEQTGYSLGPFLLLVCVSMVLCWVRLSTRSLAASTLVHSSYNLLLFTLMLLGTGGFRHLDKM